MEGILKNIINDINKECLLGKNKREEEILNQFTEISFGDEDILYIHINDINNHQCLIYDFCMPYQRKCLIGVLAGDMIYPCGDPTLYPGCLDGLVNAQYLSIMYHDNIPYYITANNIIIDQFGTPVTIFKAREQ